MPLYRIWKDEAGFSMGFPEGRADVYWFERVDGEGKRDWVMGFNKEEAKALIIERTDRDATFTD